MATEDAGAPPGPPAGDQAAAAAGSPPAGPAPVGDRVERTGLALVHEGEYILPAAGSEAALSPVSGAGQVVNYYFPVEVELVGHLDAAVLKLVLTEVFAEFDREMASRL